MNAEEQKRIRVEEDEAGKLISEMVLHVYRNNEENKVVQAMEPTSLLLAADLLYQLLGSTTTMTDVPKGQEKSAKNAEMAANRAIDRFIRDQYNRVINLICDNIGYKHQYELSASKNNCVTMARYVSVMNSVSQSVAEEEKRSGQKVSLVNVQVRDRKSFESGKVEARQVPHEVAEKYKRGEISQEEALASSFEPGKPPADDHQTLTTVNKEVSASEPDASKSNVISFFDAKTTLESQKNKQ